jgi:hypothetical protein
VELPIPATRQQGHAWQVLIKEHHQGFIDWQTYEANQQRIAHNTRPGRHKAGRAVREGSALRRGLAYCRHRGRCLRTNYHGRNSSPGYHCAGERLVEGRGSYCLNIGGVQIDDAVARAFLAALEPAKIRATRREESDAAPGHSDRRTTPLGVAWCLRHIQAGHPSMIAPTEPKTTAAPAHNLARRFNPADRSEVLCCAVSPKRMANDAHRSAADPKTVVIIKDLMLRSARCEFNKPAGRPVPTRLEREIPRSRTKHPAGCRAHGVPLARVRVTSKASKERQARS